MNQPLMPKATAVWLVDNTVLTFDQIAFFCGMHPLEVKGIADGEVAQGIQGQDPVASGQLTAEELERCSKDPSAKLQLKKPAVDVPEPSRKGGRYTPLSRRQDRPNAIAWLLRYHPEMTDAQVAKIVGTTKPTILAVRERTHWNMPNIKPVDPVTLGLCKQIDLDTAVQKAQAKLQRRKEKEEKDAAKARAAQLEAARAAGLPSAQLEEDTPPVVAEDTPPAMAEETAAAPSFDSTGGNETAADVFPATSEPAAQPPAEDSPTLASVFGDDKGDEEQRS